MPPTRLVPILVSAIVAAGLTVWLGALWAADDPLRLTWLAPIPLVLSALLLLRRAAPTRPGSAEDDGADRLR